MQNSSMQDSSSSITTRRYFITGSQRLSNFFWASLIFLGGTGFLLTGFSSFLNRGFLSVDSGTPEVPKIVDFVEQSVPSFGIQEQGLSFLQEQNKHQMGLNVNILSQGSYYTCPFTNCKFVRNMQNFVTGFLNQSTNDTNQNFVTGFLNQKEREQIFLQIKDSYLYLPSEIATVTPLEDNTYAKQASNFSILPLANSSIKFFPQGLIMCFYGCSALIFSLYLWLTILWKVGNGFNEFNKETGVVRIFRWGLPGKDRQIDFSYALKDIEALRVTLKEGINPRRTIALQIKGKGEIPLTRIGEPMALQDIENQASELANFLKIEIQVLNKS